MSRDLIESGLGWSWTPLRITKEINAGNANVIVAGKRNPIMGFAIMKYLDDEARLNLLAVHPRYQRQGIGTRLLQWLEETARVNGNGVIYLETRLANQAARKFYETAGYQIIQYLPGYYRGRETAIRMAHDLWLTHASR
ncbi:MAG: GNAT family N-acetyltransferase [Thiothrix sp.]|nr:GNAT family N-acetyltransferase [Thiothrix sp.]HPQ97456.1 GNAT family N-acetyltransferase [Thiolinea sp.]